METKEARIAINGQPLSLAESIALRVAVTGMLSRLSEKRYMKDLGPIGPLYKENLLAILERMFADVDEQQKVK